MAKSSDGRGKPADPERDPAESAAGDLPRATVVPQPDTDRPEARAPERVEGAFPRWVWLAGAGALLVIGWAFILFQNSFHLTAPVVFVCLGYGAGVAAVYTLFRTGASVVTGAEDEGDDAGWGRPVGARAELEREKKALLKAIKEAEFDLQMGKLSKADAEAMIASYRAKAIAVIREIDRKDGAGASAREQIEREVRARLEVAKAKQAGDADKRPAGKKGKKQAAAAAAAAKADEPAGKADEATGKAVEAGAKTDETSEAADAQADKAEQAAAAVEAVSPAAGETDPPEEPATHRAAEAAAGAQLDAVAARDEGEALADPRSAEPRGAAPAAGVAKEATS